MSGLTEFLRARLDEDKQAARRALDWWDSDREAGYFEWPSREASTHVARHDPARVLREVEAKRRMLDDVWGGPDHEEMWDHHVRLLALPYAQHPGYRPEWAPDV